MELCMLVLVFFCLFCSWRLVPGQPFCEKSVLLEFKQTVYDPHGILSGWNTHNNSDHCSWLGVTCNLKKRVVSINIPGGTAHGYQGNSDALSCLKSLRFPLHEFGIRRACLDHGGKLQGNLSPLIAKLGHLRVLSLPFHQFIGDIPLEIWNLKSMRVLDLEGNLLGGKLPNAFVGLRRLRVLNLGFNRFDGVISASFLKCMALEILNLSGNKLNGLIPDFFASFQKLRGLYLANNELNGTVPGVLSCNCLYLEHLDLSGNFLTGRIPSTLVNCKQLRTLLLFSNALNDSIPREMGMLRRLEVLDISRNFIGGVIPVELGNCTQLSVLVLSSLSETLSCSSGVATIEHNHFQGSVPMEITALPKLRVLWAPGAALKGKLPQNWGGCERLEMLNLAQNNLGGDVKRVLDGCKKLHYLDISSTRLTGILGSRNLMSGIIPGFNFSFCPIAPSLNSENLTAFLLDNNNRSGEVPSCSFGVALTSTISQSAEMSKEFPLNRKVMGFSSSHGKSNLGTFRRFLLPALSSDLTGSNDVSSRNASSSSDPKSGNNGLNSIEIASIASASAIVSIWLALAVVFFCTRKRTPVSRVQVIEPKDVTVFADIGVPILYENIVQATGNFNASNCIGNGGFGATYKAEISPGFLLAIKKLSIGKFQGVQQFHAEIEALGRVSHPNLVTLIGYYASEAEMFLIYNYLPGGNLEDFIKERSTSYVNWRIFHKIALHVANALAYLHDQCNPRILHRDVKPSNILLDNEHNAYLSDFGLSRLLGNSETHVTTGVAGTFGYVAPEYAMTCRVSEKADVYSYGVVLLELISDKKALDPSFCAHENGFNIVSWACMLLRRGRAKEVFTAGLWDSGPRDDMVQILHLAVTCTDETLSTRPTMKQVAQRLKRIQPF